MHYQLSQPNSSADDKNRIGAISRKALRRGVTHTALILRKSSTVPIANFLPVLPNPVTVYIIFLPKPLHTAPIVCGKDQLPHIEFSQYKNSFINRCLFGFRWLISVLLPVSAMFLKCFIFWSSCNSVRTTLKGYLTWLDLISRLCRRLLCWPYLEQYYYCTSYYLLVSNVKFHGWMRTRQQQQRRRRSWIIGATSEFSVRAHISIHCGAPNQIFVGPCPFGLYSTQEIQYMLFHMFTDLLVKQFFRKSYTERFFEVGSSFPLVTYRGGSSLKILGALPHQPLHHRVHFLRSRKPKKYEFRVGRFEI